MENINIPVGCVAIPLAKYDALKEDSLILNRLLPYLMDRITVRDDYLDHTKPRVVFDEDGLLTILEVLCPDEYFNTVHDKIEAWKRAKAAEAKGEEE